MSDADAQGVPEDPNDGGARSLLGYLYQLLGSAAARIELSEPMPDGGGNACIVSVELEEHGQDATVRRGGRIRLIQFKHSNEMKSIDPADLADVLVRLESSTVYIAAGGRTVDWELCTNRELGPVAAEILAGGEPGNVGRTDPKNIATIKRLGGRLTITKHSLADYEQKLLERARRFGVKDCSHVKRGVVGYLMVIAGRPRGDRHVRLEELDAILAGWEQPLFLDARDPGCSERRVSELKDVISLLQGPPVEDALPRESIMELLSRPDVASAVIFGHGGSGKTLSVLRALHDLVGQRSLLVGALLPGPEFLHRTFEELVSSWRSKIVLPPETFRMSMERVLLANPGLGRPILVLALDGLDESRWEGDLRRHAESLLLRFNALHQQPSPPALLIVTCRERSEVEQLLAPDGAGGPSQRPAEFVELGDFDLIEFERVWRKWFPQEQIPAVQAGDVGGGRGAELGGPENRLAALRHPVLLGCLRSWSAAERQMLLAPGDEAEWQKLLGLYLDWFSNKVTKRRGIPRQLVRSILKAAARQCARDEEAATYDRQMHWVDPGRADTGRPENLIRDVFDDAVSSGIVDAYGYARYTMAVTIPVKWRWHFDFIPKLLVTLA